MPMVASGENQYHILLALSEGDKRFSELVREIKRASLARELNRLERQKYLKRRVIDTKPPTTIYSLTEIGRGALKFEAEKHVQKLELELGRLKTVMPEKVKELKDNL